MTRLLALVLALGLAWGRLGLELTLGLDPRDLALSEDALVVRATLREEGVWAELVATPEQVRLGQAGMEARLGPFALQAGRLVLSTGQRVLDRFNPKDTDEPLPLLALALSHRPSGTSLLYAPRFEAPLVLPELPAGVVRVEHALPAPLVENGVFGLYLKRPGLWALALYTYTPTPRLKALLDATEPQNPCPDPEKGPCIAVLGHERELVLGAGARPRPDLGLELLFVPGGYLEGALWLEEKEATLAFEARLGPAPRHLVELGLFLPPFEARWRQELLSGSFAFAPRLRYPLGEGKEIGLGLEAEGDPEAGLKTLKLWLSLKAGSLP